MKKLILLIPTILLFSIASFAQTDSEKPVEWKTLAPATEEFSVDAPESLQFSVFYSEDVNPDYDKTENRRYRGIANKTYFFIFSDVSAYDPQFKTALNFVIESQPAEAEKQKKLNSMKFEFSDDENFFHTIYAFKTKKRSYIFHSVSEIENDPNVERFFKSIQINKKTASARFKEEKAQKPVKKSDKSENDDQTESYGNPNPNVYFSKPSTTIGSGKGTGEGSGSGIGSGKSSPDSENKTSEIKALNITLKPKPRYTIFARFYEITGILRIRTTFLNDGTIGSATALTRLPFGLTAQAIAAAKQIRFEPQTVNGTPVSVTKVVVFAFTIY